MAAITASMVKELREMTDAGMMECKKALVEADGDMEKAVDVLRTRGLAAAAKKAGRATNEGTVMTVLADDAKSAAVVELNCETDFVGMNEKFKAYAEKLGRAALAANAADVEALRKDAGIIKKGERSGKQSVLLLKIRPCKTSFFNHFHHSDFILARAP